MDADFSDEPEWIKITALILSCSFFAGFLTLEFVALRKIKFKVERTGIILLCAYSITMCQRLIFDSIRLVIQEKTQ